jgi:hypothetical protein
MMLIPPEAVVVAVLHVEMASLDLLAAVARRAS